MAPSCALKTLCAFIYFLFRESRAVSGRDMLEADLERTLQSVAREWGEQAAGVHALLIQWEKKTSRLSASDVSQAKLLTADLLNGSLLSAFIGPLGLPAQASSSLQASIKLPPRPGARRSMLQAVKWRGTQVPPPAPTARRRRANQRPGKEA